MPAFGSDAVPLPTKNRQILPGCHPTAAIDAATGPAGSPLVTAAAALGVLAALPDSRRDTATSAHPNGATTGASPPEPDHSHANTPAPTPATEPDAAARAGAAIAATATGVETACPAAGFTESDDDPLSSSSAETAAEPSETTGASTDTKPPPGTVADDGTEAVEAEGSEPRRPGVAATNALPPECADPVDAPPDESDEPETEPRPDRRDGTLVFVDPADAGEPAPEPEPVEPAEPVVSANATGIAATAEPIPNATASAPTRPI